MATEEPNDKTDYERAIQKVWDNPYNAVEVWENLTIIRDEYNKLVQDNAALKERIEADMREIERLRAIIDAVKKYTEGN